MAVFVSAAAATTQARQFRSIGALTPFYRSMQLQGHLFGMGLIEVPPYLLSQDLAFPYHPKAGFQREIPFVDSFSINRVLGGYREDWLSKFKLLDPKLGRRSLDYVVRGKDGSLIYRPELIRARLQPYLDAGYKPSDITLALDNTPWDLATPTGAAPVEGEWGRKTPPGDLQQWSTVIQHFAQDLKAYLGPAAAEISFETGVEYDEKASFDGTPSEFFQYYAQTAKALRSVLPGAHFGPGEFTVLGVCNPGAANCVYDTRDLIAFARAQQLGPDSVPRSLHSLVDRPNPFPSAAEKRFADSFSRLPPIPAEIHQFGRLFQPFGEVAGNDVGPMQANWEAQTLLGLMAQGAPRRVFHWGGLVTMGPASFLNGSGYLRLILDHYVGSTVSFLPVVDVAPDRPYPAAVVAVSMIGGPQSAVIVSSFSPKPAAGLRRISVELPAALLRPGSHLKIVRYRGGEDVFSAVRHDLAADGNLRPDFATCALCVGPPVLMAVDQGRARSLVGRNWPLYRSIIQASLKWSAADDSVKLDNGTLTALMGANELLVIEEK